MRKIVKMFMIGCILSTLTACGTKSVSGEKLVQDITAGSGKNTEAVGEKDSAKSDTEQAPGDLKENIQEGAYVFAYGKVSLTPGEYFDASALTECPDISEVPSCAFDGVDRVYNYEDFELTTHVEGEKEKIYAIYLINPNLSTTEGLHLGDTMEDMNRYYGENYTMEENAYIYTRGDTILSVIIRDENVVSLEYRMRE